MKIICCLSLLLFGALFGLREPAWAVNIRVIGNGGGEQEMRRLTQLSMVLDTIEVCLRPGNFCDLSESELTNLQLLKRSPEKIVDASRLLQVTSYQGGILSENSALTLAYLGALTKQNWRGLADVPMPWVSLVRKIFDDHHWQYGEASWQHSDKTQETFHLVNVKGGLRRAALYSDKGEGWIDLNSRLQKVLPCGQGARILELGPKVNREQNGLSFAVVWTCGQGEYQARILAFEGSSQFQVYAVRLISDSLCQPLLGLSRKTP